MVFYHFQLKKAVFGPNFGKKISNRGEKSAPRGGPAGAPRSGAPESAPPRGSPDLSSPSIFQFFPRRTTQSDII